MKDYNLQKTVTDLNSIIDKSLGYNSDHSFSYCSTGYVDCIKFNEQVLWDSENDTRKYYEFGDFYEELTTTILREFYEYIDTISKIRINLV